MKEVTFAVIGLPLSPPGSGPLGDCKFSRMKAVALVATMPVSCAGFDDVDDFIDL